MLLNKIGGRRLSALSLCTVVAFAPLSRVQADEPEVILATALLLTVSRTSPGRRRNLAQRQ